MVVTAQGGEAVSFFQDFVNGSLRTDAVSPLCVPAPGGLGVQWCQPVSGMQEGRACGGPAESHEGEQEGMTDPEV